MPSEIRFYQLNRGEPERVLADLLERTLQRGWRAVVLTGSAERTAALNQLLWTYRPDSFLPHGSAADGEADHQPVWLTHTPENPNAAQVCFCLDAMPHPTAMPAGGDFSLICDLFDGRDPIALADARQRWQQARGGEVKLAYWAQSADGWTQQGAASR